MQESVFVDGNLFYELWRPNDGGLLLKRVLLFSAYNFATNIVISGIEEF